MKKKSFSFSQLQASQSLLLFRRAKRDAFGGGLNVSALKAWQDLS
jgi:hypothetical protein